jgi:transcription antitermination factor NusG
METESNDRDLLWYALQVRSRFEKVISRNLQGKGYEEFLPVYQRQSRWSDRTKEIELPLFPGYVFCRFNALYRLPILMIPGVVSVVGIGKSPIAVTNDEIENIRMVLQSGSAYEPWPYLTVGQTVRVEFGALAGLKGTVVLVKNTYRLVISVNLLHRSVAVEIDRDCLKPESNPLPRSAMSLPALAAARAEGGSKLQA